jgi:hypothetical protein
MVKASGKSDFNIPPELIPEVVDNNAEIWRYKKGVPEVGWQRVHKAVPQGGNVHAGFRYMVRYTSPVGDTALYAGSYSSQKVITLRSTNGVVWNEIPNNNLKGTSTRSMVIHSNGKLYMSTVEEGNYQTPNPSANIYEYVPPTDCNSQGSWKEVTGNPQDPAFDPGKNPTGQISIMASFNQHLYAGTTKAGGFELWRTEGTAPEVDKWKLVIDKGAGDALNKIPLTLGVFKDHLYVGAIMFPLLAQSAFSLAAFKPFDLIRIDQKDRWELVIGGKPVEPTNPQTGTRGNALSGKPSGLGNIFNLYCWQLEEYGGEFYLGTFDWSVLIPPLIAANLPLLTNIPGLSSTGPTGGILNIGQGSSNTLSKLINLVIPFSGFDLYKSKDGIHWEPITLNGLDNPHNYGARVLFPSTNGLLYLGTANPFDGLEVWVK